MLHFELTPHDRTIENTIYSSQLERACEILRAHYPGLINRKRISYQLDCAPAHRSRLAQGNWEEIDEIGHIQHIISGLHKIWDLDFPSINFSLL